MKIMCVVNEMEALMEMKQLYDQEELNEDGANRWETLSRQVRGGHFVDDLLDLLDRDIELTSQLQRILITTGTNMQEIIMGGVALGVYILERLYPNDHGCDVFGKFWCDVCLCNEASVTAIDSAIKRALDKMVANPT